VEKSLGSDNGKRVSFSHIATGSDHEWSVDVPYRTVKTVPGSYYPKITDNMARTK
jgi:hypothetical protein